MIVFKEEKSKLNLHLPESYVFVCFSSFETRCLTIPRLLKRENVRNAYIICNTEGISAKNNEDNAQQIGSHFEQAEIVCVNIRKAFSIAEAMANIVSKLLENGEETVVIDISTFTHEALLILIKLIYANKKSFVQIKCLYNGASRYSVGDLLSNMWLSKGCRDVRNVIGYPGKIDPTKKNHLIIMTGFEMERATGLIELLAPDVLTLGNGCEPTENDHNETMKFFEKKFNEWKSNFVEILTEPFKFSCSDVEKTADILRKITQNKEDNFLIAPLNTKLSTVAVGLVALNNPAIQVCYAIPEVYNIKNYSEPSNNVTILDMKQLFEREVIR